MAATDGDGAAESRQQEEASTSGASVPEEIQDFVAQQTALFERVEALSDKPVRVRRYKIIGLERTQEAIVERELEALDQVRTFGQLREALDELYLALESLDIFSAINLTAAEPPLGVSHPEWCDVVVSVAERKRLGLHIGTFVQGAQGSVDMNASLTNALGLAEHAQLSWEVGKQPTSIAQLLSAGELVSEIALKLSRQRPGALPLAASLSLHQLSRDNRKWASYKETMRGGVATLSSEDGAHQWSYELGWRQLADPSRRASQAVKQQLGHSLKSSLSYLHRRSTFDHPFWPTRGWGLRSSTELAGLWLDPRALRFAKQELHGQWVAQLAPGVVLALSGSAGLLLPWGRGAWDRPSPLSERFSAGGASGGMRGFFFKGLGETDLRKQPPRTQRNGAADANGSEPAEEEPQGRLHDFLGGDLQCSAMAALRFQIPWAKPLHEAGFFGQVFLNACSSVLLSGQGRLPREAAARTADRVRYSAGAGLVWPMSIGNVELNYVRVLRSLQTDEWRHGVHIGCTADLF